MRGCYLALAIVAALLASACRPAPARKLEASFWVWNRDEGLTQQEQRQLTAAGVKRLFWQVGELELQGHSLVWKEQHPLPAATSSLRFIPTLRINARAASPSEWAESLVEKVKPFEEFQLDFDCKTSRLEEYRQALRALRTAYPGRKFSITALAHWPQAAHWQELMREVDEVFPMFYDLQPDGPLKPGEKPNPMVEVQGVSKWAAKWRSCPVPWHMGLPNMTRLTVFGSDGGRHQRSWDQNSLRALGAPVLREGQELVLWREGGQVMALRRPGDRAMVTALNESRRQGAVGVTWFSLPQAGRAGRGWSVPHLHHLMKGEEGAPRLEFSMRGLEGGKSLQLANTGNADVIADMDGQVLRLKIRPGDVRELLPGRFPEVQFQRDGKMAAGPREADEVRLRFDRLDAGETMETDLVRFSPSFNCAVLSWSIESAKMK